eukprot:TRINITY_DN15564_c0_g2_i2.p1 TRINITY_DN15564_c0_g2~~TRINITY_DN15564_c0_g2_i2.p1  ORF type:complete len:202 (+),score=-19.34 TRINITY_DN15564_c0_g2_i2:84-608(+)
MNLLGCFSKSSNVMNSQVCTEFQYKFVLFLKLNKQQYQSLFKVIIAVTNFILFILSSNIVWILKIFIQRAWVFYFVQNISTSIMYVKILSSTHRSFCSEIRRRSMRCIEQNYNFFFYDVYIVYYLGLSSKQLVCKQLKSFFFSPCIPRNNILSFLIVVCLLFNIYIIMYYFLFL